MDIMLSRSGNYRAGCLDGLHNHFVLEIVFLLMGLRVLGRAYEQMSQSEERFRT